MLKQVTVNMPSSLGHAYYDTLFPGSPSAGGRSRRGEWNKVRKAMEAEKGLPKARLKLDGRHCGEDRRTGECRGECESGVQRRDHSGR